MTKLNDREGSIGIQVYYIVRAGERVGIFSIINAKNCKLRMSAPFLMNKHWSVVIRCPMSSPVLLSSDIP